MDTPPTVAAQTASPTQKDHRERRRLVVVASGKGGTGNSFAARVLLNYIAERGCDVIGVDTYPQRPTFRTFVRDTKMCRSCDLGEANAFDSLIELSLNHGYVFMDLPFGEFDRFEHWLLHSGFTEIAPDYGIELTFVFVLGPEPETVAIVSRGLKAVKNIGQVIAAKNLRGKAIRWSDDQELLISMLAEGTAVIELPELNGDIAQAFGPLGMRFGDTLPDGSQRQEPLHAVSWHVQRFWALLNPELARIEKRLF